MKKKGKNNKSKLKIFEILKKKFKKNVTDAINKKPYKPFSIISSSTLLKLNRVFKSVPFEIKIIQAIKFKMIIIKYSI